MKELNIVLMVFVIVLWILFIFQFVPIYVPLLGNVAQLVLLFFIFQDNNVVNPHSRIVTRKAKTKPDIKLNRKKKLNKIWGK